MTLINRLIKEAREGAAVLEVPENHVRSVAEHMRQSIMIPSQPTFEECEAGLRSGEAKLMGVPMKVVPKRT
ncbi:hypothetical protein J2X36_002160 [Methylobacterium sp. BE186]|uniref:hypothetical protein n=1 Tax=Methylobacterium sp. BE186 TaxID=2817715 RepID=UPI00285E7103|nr:hypothetical protein [Methylobacterium sp. BE186]MDR7037413.1 hypothetical protein [Methylobacterium sp. BE186]